VSQETIFKPVSIIMRLTSFSENEFFRIIQNNSQINLKTLCKKICRDQVFKIMKRLDSLQKYLNIIIFSRNAEFCKITNLPIINLQFHIKIEIIEIENKEKIAIITPL
jgi:hypothetical protein